MLSNIGILQQFQLFKIVSLKIGMSQLRKQKSQVQTHFGGQKTGELLKPINKILKQLNVVKRNVELRTKAIASRNNGNIGRRG